MEISRQVVLVTTETYTAWWEALFNSPQFPPPYKHTQRQGVGEWELFSNPTLQSLKLLLTTCSQHAASSTCDWESHQKKKGQPLPSGLPPSHPPSWVSGRRQPLTSAGEATAALSQKPAQSRSAGVSPVASLHAAPAWPGLQQRVGAGGWQPAPFPALAPAACLPALQPPLDWTFWEPGPPWDGGEEPWPRERRAQVGEAEFQSPAVCLGLAHSLAAKPVTVGARYSREGKPCTPLLAQHPCEQCLVSSLQKPPLSA